MAFELQDACIPLKKSQRPSADCIFENHLEHKAVDEKSMCFFSLFEIWDVQSVALSVALF